MLTWGSSSGWGAWIRDMWKRDSVYVRRVLSGMLGEPREGVMSSRRARKEEMSKSWSVVMVEEGASSQSAVVIPLAIVTIAVQIERVMSSLRFKVVMIGRIAFRIAREDVVACRQGGMVLVVMGNAYFSVIGLAKALSEDATAPLV